MDWQEFFSQGLSLIGTFNYKIALYLFLVNLIGEALSIFVPYLLEATWIMAGYQFSEGILSFPNLLLLIVVALAGREIGTLFLYGISRSGSKFLKRYTNRFTSKIKSDSLLLRLFRKLNYLSPFSVALGRLIWLRIPLTLILGAEGKLKVLILGVVISSLIYDATYITLGAIVGNATRLEPIYILLYSLAGLTVLYGVTFIVRRLIISLINRLKVDNSSTLSSD